MSITPAKGGKAASGESGPGTTVDEAAAVFLGMLSEPSEEQQAASEDTPEVETEEVETPEGEVEETPPEPEAEEIEEESDTPPVRSRKLRLPDGTEEEVSEDEAYLGYLRQKDYTRKTQQAAEAKKLAEAEAETFRKGRAEYAAHLEQVKQGMDSMVPKEPNWVDLRAKVPADEFAATWAEWQQFSEQRNLVIAEQKKVAEQTTADLKKTIAEETERQRQLTLEAIPAWKDQAVALKEGKELLAWMKEKGFDDERIGAINDHRLIVSLRNSMLWDRLQAKKPQAKAKAGKLKPAPAGSPAAARRPATEKQRDFARLRESGTTDDAARALVHFID